MADPEFHHVHRPPAAAAGPTLLLLHGTGGNEHDLLPLAGMLAPAAGILSPRGKVLERGMPRFFRRLAEGVFDLDDLRARTAELGDFVAASARTYGFDPQRVVAVGFSNGANIAASLLLLRPEMLAGAVLFRAMVPIVPEPLPELRGTPVFMANGRTDPLIPAAEAERLARLLEAAGAHVTTAWQPGGHELGRDDIDAAKGWLGPLLNPDPPR